PSPGNPNGIVSAFWRDLYPPNGAVYYETQGVTPNRQFILQFQGVPQCCGTSLPATWEIVLSETSNEILIQYVDAETSGNVASAGIENQSGTIGIQWQFGPFLTVMNTAVRYIPQSGLNSDADSDGVADCLDNCPATANPAQTDCDGDGIGDACDPDATDMDGDGVADACDNCPAGSNPGQEDADFDGIGDACDSCVGFGSDSDGDGICDFIDNCPAVANPGQEDTDSDGFGDACDSCVGFGATDSDGDGRCDPIDNCPTVFNPGQEDTDFNGIGDA